MLRIVASSSSSKLIPIAFRARNAFPNPLLSGRRFSSKSYAAAHTMLAKAFDSEIKHAQLISSRPEAPADFPFKIQHALGGEVTLTRELDGEEIEVRLLGVDGGATTTDSSDSESDSDWRDCSYKEPPLRSVDLKIEISKSNGKSMDFKATASAVEIVIERLTTTDKDDKVICSQLHIAQGSQLQMAFREFLEKRGIEKSIATFLYDYTVWNSTIPYSGSVRSLESYTAEKSNQQNVEILEKLKKVISGWY